jgi:hypothetical protein
MPLKNSFKKGCQIFAAHMEEEDSDKVGSLEHHPKLRDFANFF